MTDHGALPLATRILASAGAGKTFALTSRYLALVRRGVDPRRILATTFSRAAAAEIAARVLRRAAEAVLDPARRDVLARAMAAECADAAPEPFDASAATALLAELVRGLPRAQIRTLDSFHAGVVAASAAELGISGVPRVMDDGEERGLLLEAIAAALEEGDEKELLATILSLVQGRRVAAVVATVEQQVGDLLELYSNSLPEAWDWSVPPPRGAESAAGTRDALQRLGELCPDKRLGDQLRKDAAKVERAIGIGGEAWRPNQFGKLLQQAVSGKALTSYKTAVPTEVEELYHELARLVVAKSRHDYARMTEAMASLAARIARHRSRLARQKGLASFADLVALLDPSRNQLPALTEIWFRLDGRVQHLLLDEFQDTSVVQWRALSPLVEELVAGGEEERSLFVVGDVKQAIYGWRGGEPRLLGELPELLGPAATHIEERQLVRSHRSSPRVIEFVNHVFGRLLEHEEFEEDARAAAAAWQRRFATHETAVTSPEGLVELRAVPFGDGSRPEFARQVEAVREIVHGLRARLPRTASIGVIVRRTDSVARLARALQRDGHAVRIVGRGALLDREAPLAVLQALRLAECPIDTLAAFDLARSPLAPLVGLDGIPPHSAPEPGQTASASRGLRKLFESRGVAAVIDEWRRRLAPVLDDHEALRLEQLVAVVERLAASADRSPGEIAALVMKARVEHAGGGEIALMNVHQSKGLEFDAVVVADLETKLEGESPKRRIAWVSPARPSDPIPRVVRWIPKELHEALPEMSALCRATLDRQIEESLSALYVALTRAKRELHVVVSEPKDTKGGARLAICSGTLASILRGAAKDGAERPDSECPELWYRLGTACEAERDAEALRPTPPPRPARELPRLVTARRRRHRAAPASTPHDREALFALRDRDAMDRGTAFHVGLVAVRWIDEPRDERVMSRALRLALPGRDESWRRARLDELEQALTRPGLRALLTRPGTGAEARNEHRYVRVGAEGVQEGSIDRLVLHREAGGRLLRAEILDYKTDQVGVDELELLVARHGEQLRRYRELVAEQFGLPLERISMALFALAHDARVEIPS
ncbi:MAG: UvrD-helicase domain-containing protein [Planctomycetes bacterium]|nr:UvrD-helicase domain-containing protein [Planctomycetota bacterium]